MKNLEDAKWNNHRETEWEKEEEKVWCEKIAKANWIIKRPQSGLIEEGNLALVFSIFLLFFFCYKLNAD